MNIRNSYVGFLLPLILITLFGISCDSDDEVKASGEVEIQITDAPSDDGSIQGVFITVADIKIDGTSYAGFQSKQTFDISALQNGQTKILGLADLEAGSYSSLTLVLDTETDADGNVPGCYVLRTNNEKESLASSNQTTIEITAQKSIQVTENVATTLIIDFDLRKSMQYEDDGSSQNTFSFVSENELESAIRVVDEDNTGSIQGSFDTSLALEKVIVFAYPQGTFNQNIEVQGSGNGNLLFSNAIASAEAQGGPITFNYNLSFLQAGNYELCVVALSDTEGDGKFFFSGFLSGSTIFGNSLTAGASITAGVANTLNLDIVTLID